MLCSGAVGDGQSGVDAIAAGAQQPPHVHHLLAPCTVGAIAEYSRTPTRRHSHAPGELNKDSCAPAEAAASINRMRLVGTYAQRTGALSTHSTRRGAGGAAHADDVRRGARARAADPRRNARRAAGAIGHVSSHERVTDHTLRSPAHALRNTQWCGCEGYSVVPVSFQYGYSVVRV